MSMLNSQSVKLQKLRKCGEDIVLFSKEVPRYVLKMVHRWHVLVDHPLQGFDVRLLCLYQLLHKLPAFAVCRVRV